MAKVVEVQLIAKTDDAVAGVNKVEKAVEKTGRSAKKTNKELSAFSEGGKQLVGALDRQTGGLASKFVAIGKAAKLSGKAMKTALISSGIGAAVVAIGLLVEYWDEIKGLVDGVSSEQATLLKTTEDTLAAQQEQLSATGSMENTLKLQGKTEKEIRDLKRQQTDEIIASTELLLEQQKEQKKAQIEAAERNQNITKGIIAFLTAPIVVLLGLVDGLTNSLASLGILDEGTRLTEGFLELSSSLVFDPEEVAESGEETIKATEETLIKLKNTRDGFLLKDKEAAKTTANDKKNDEIEAEKTKAAALERIRKGLIDTEAEERAEKLRLIKEDYNQQIALAAEFYGANSIKILELKAAQKAAEDEQQAIFAEQDKAKQDKIDADKETKRLKGIEDAKKVAEELAALEEKKRQDRLDTFDNLIAIGGAETKFGQAMLIAKQLLLAKELIMDVKSTLFSAKNSATKTVIKSAEAGVDIAGGAAKAVSAAPFPANIPLIVGYAAQAVGIISAIRSAVKASKAATKGIGGGGGGDISAPSIDGGSVPPAFNIVGASGETQLADAIGSQTQRPARAYVVSNDVTTAQEMDRNIIEGASIG
jgi:hypothetical protein